MTDVPATSVRIAEVTRRDLLRVGALVALAGPVVAACAGPVAPTGPDPLLALVDAAQADVAAARAAAAAFPDTAPTLDVVATARQQHVSALQTEVARANISTPTDSKAANARAAPPVPASGTDATAALSRSLAAAQQQAAILVPRLPRYRAGLVGSVSAGCASLVEALG